MTTPFVYRTASIDPPWNERGAGKSKRGADRHYPVLKTEDIARVILRAPWEPAPDAHLYLWATNTHLLDAGQLMRFLGFRYITCITWAKPSFGIGQYFRGQTEHMLFGVRGKGLALRREHTDRRDLSTLICTLGGMKRIHSRKPIESFEHIEAASPGPYIELFARSGRENWDSWGNEISKKTGS